MTFGTVSTERMRINASGNVGIGTNNPSQQLHITGDALIGGGDLYLTDTNEKIASDGTDLLFHVNGSETVRFKSGGNVGIGTTSPKTALQIGAEGTSDGVGTWGTYDIEAGSLLNTPPV